MPLNPHLKPCYTTGHCQRCQVLGERYLHWHRPVSLLPHNFNSNERNRLCLMVFLGYETFRFLARSVVSFDWHLERQCWHYLPLQIPAVKITDRIGAPLSAQRGSCTNTARRSTSDSCRSKSSNRFNGNSSNTNQASYIYSLHLCTNTKENK